MRSVLSPVRHTHLHHGGLARRLALASYVSHKGLAPITNPHVAEETHNREQKPGLRAEAIADHHSAIVLHEQAEVLCVDNLPGHTLYLHRATLEQTTIDPLLHFRAADV